ncbi:MAG: hypothetical protein KI790_08315, partial [Cyclobacteriaceae bacterium]|nr:hypothetical protein [Cyclobacteriaceae bacterium HetDA_MAG_MS6]
MKKLIYLVLPMIVCGELSAQQLGFQINVGVPHDEFKEKTDAVGVGGKINLLFPIAPDNPISIGGDLNYIIYGFNSQREDLRAEIRSGNTIIETIEIPLRIENTNSILGFHGMMRVDPFDGPVRPYLQGLFGFRYISTNTKIIDRSWNNRWSSEDDNVIVRRTNLEDFTFSYGFGGGLMFQINGNVYLD